jgi:hypothetical protein
VAIEYDHPLGQTVRVFEDEAADEPLVEIRLDRSERLVPGMEVLVLEWILLQDTSRRFTASRPPLPGQQFPGLGLFHNSFLWLTSMCDTLGVDGLYLRPSHYHVAAKVQGVGRFFDPGSEAVFRAIQAALGSTDLWEASWALARGRMIDASTDTAVGWDPAPMVLPTSLRMRELLFGERYESQVATKLGSLTFRLRDDERPS